MRRAEDVGGGGQVVRVVKGDVRPESRLTN